MPKCLNPRRLRAWALAGPLALLAACGGGGGEEAPPSQVSLGGVVDIPAGVAVDNDVNDPGEGQNGPSNDPGNPELPPGTEFPQSVESPVTIAGYVNRAGSGPLGASRVDGDPDDYFRVSLDAGQSISLNIADRTAADLDLFLWDAEGAGILDSSAGVGQRESLNAPEAGTFVVNVFAFSGASNYTLAIGQGAATTEGLRLSEDFAPGELIVRPRPGAGLSAQALGAGGPVERAGANELWRWSLGGVQALGVESAATHPKARHLAEGLQPKWQTLMVAKALRGRPDIQYADPNYRRYPLRLPNDPGFESQWHYPLINLPQAWDTTTGLASPRVIVAVVDTGILPDHPDLAGQLVAGFDFVSDPANAGDGDGRDSDPTDPGDGQGVGGASSFHGTHVAGTVAAATNNNRGVAGVAWNARIMPLRALGLQGGNSFDIQQAVLYAAGLENQTGQLPDQPADVINLSLGAPASSPAEQALFTDAREAGVILVAAAGNNGDSTPIFPASYDGVVSVSAVGPDASRAFYSNFGPGIDVAAPGGDMRADRDGDGFPDGVLSTGGDDSGTNLQFVFPFQQGTSMAAPHVAGVAALMEAAARDAGPDLSPARFDQLLQTGQITVDLGDPGRDDLFGHGLIDARQAVLAGSERIPLEPTLGVAPGSLNFASTATEAVLQVSNLGDGELTVVEVTDDFSGPLDWLSVTPDQVGPNGLGSYRVRVDRTSLDPGTFTGNILIASSAGNATVPVRLTVLAGGGADANAGRHFVLLVDQNEPDPEQQVKQQVAVVATGGQYPFAFDEVPADGAYLVVAGTDFDNDGFICDGGEACGAFPTLDQPAPLSDLSGDRTNLDFFTGFQVQVRLSQSEESGDEPRRGWPLLRRPGKRLP